MTVTIKVRSKRCTACGQAKELDQFRKRERGKYGRNSVCKRCESIASQEYKKAHPEKAKAHFKKWVQKNREYVNAYARELYAKNREARNAQQRQRRAKKKAAIATDCNPTKAGE